MRQINSFTILQATAGTGRWSGGRHRFTRRANALIMAVSMTVLLAIIGSAFVIMSRMDRQTVRNLDSTQMVNRAVSEVVRTIQNTLADDVVTFDTDTKRIKLLDASDNKQFDYPDKDYDAWLAPLEPSVSNGQYSWRTTSEIFDVSPAALDIGALASTAALDGATDADGDGVADSRWRKISALSGGQYDVWAAVRIIDNCAMVNVNTAWRMAVGRETADAIDPAADSFGEYTHQINVYSLLNRNGVSTIPFTESNGLQWTWLDGSNFYKAFKDNEDKVFYDRFLRSFQEQVVGCYESLHKVMPEWQPYTLEDEMELRNRFCINTTATTRLEKYLSKVIGEFNLNDPLGSYRTVPYRTKSEAASEEIANWGQALTNNSALATNEDKRRADQRHLLTAYSFDRDIRTHEKNLDPDAQPYPKEMDLVLDYELDEVFSSSTDPVQPANPGKWRKVNVNDMLRDFLELSDYNSSNPNNSAAHTATLATVQDDLATWRDDDIDGRICPPTPSSQEALDRFRKMAVLRLARAFAASGYYPGYPDGAVETSTTIPVGYLDQGVQFIANLIDYLDKDSTPTVFEKGTLNLVTGGDEIPSVNIYGTERQPFITQVVNVVQDPGSGGGTGGGETGGETGGGSTITAVSLESAVELYNPYDTAIQLYDATNEGWKIRWNGTDIHTFGTSDEIPAHSRIIVHTTREPAVIPVPSTAQNDYAGPINAESTFLITPTENDAELQLTRPIKLADGDTQHIVVDVVDKTASRTIAPTSGNVTATTYSTARASMETEVASTRINSEQPRHAWGFTANKFRTCDVASLGAIQKLDGGNDAFGSDSPGIPILIADRGPAIDEGSSRKVWRVHGWYELGRVLTVGNPDTVQRVPADKKPLCITEAIANESLVSGSGPGMHVRSEESVRIDWLEDQRGSSELASGAVKQRGVALMNHISLLSRNSDRVDNIDIDNDQKASTGYDTLMESRIPGRLNINTIPASVFRAIIPPLQHVVSADKFDAFADEMTEKFVQYREETKGTDEHKGFKDLAEFLQFFEDGFGSYRNWMKTNGVDLSTHSIGDSWSVDDLEERDYIWSRMVNLLTVRSDTFTAYINVRVASKTNPSDKIEKRMVALLDRSNVFLPEECLDSVPEPLASKGDANNNGRWDPGDTTNDSLPKNGGIMDDWSGERAVYEPETDTDRIHYFDRQYVRPIVVSLWPVADVK